MRKLRRSIERNRKKRIATAAAIAVISAGLLVSGPVANVRADMSGLYGGAGMLAAEANASYINICDQELIHDGVIKVNITESGSYTLTGSNFINEAYVDTTITVARGAVVDLYLDGLSIYNGSELAESLGGSGFDYTDNSANVFEINGTANIHILNDTTITALHDMFKVAGVANFVDSEDSATLTLQRSKDGNWMERYAMISGGGEVHFKNANVELINTTLAGKNGTTEYCDVQTYFDGNKLPAIQGNIEFSDMCLKYYQVSETDISFLKDKSIHDEYGCMMYAWTYPIRSLPVGGEVIQLMAYEDRDGDGKYPLPATRRAVTGLFVDSEGKLSNMVLPYYFEMCIKSGDEVRCYTSTVCGYVDTGSPARAFSVTFVDKDNTSDVMGSYWAKESDKVTLLEEDGNYIYSYSLEDGTVVDANTVVSGNTTVYVTKTEKGNVDITVNGVTKSVKYGSPLSSAGLSGYFVRNGVKRLISSDEIVTGPMELSYVALDSEIVNNKLWFKIGTAEDLEQFAQLVTISGIADVNGYLTADISYSGTMIGDFVMKYDGHYEVDFENSNFFRGSFDGRNHTVTLNYDTTDKMVTGLFGSVSAGAEIKNVITAGTVRSTITTESLHTFTGALVASVIDQNGATVTIDNCINTASVTLSSSKESEFVGGIVGGKYKEIWHSPSPETDLSITNCINTGEVTRSGSCNASYIPSGIIGYCYGSSKTSILNCINYDETPITPGGTTGNDGVTVTNSYSLKVIPAHSNNGSELTRGTEVTREEFASGEVTYLLNSNRSARTWYQTCGVGLPSLVGDAATQTVYREYENCTSTTPIYSNTVIGHTEPGHKLGEAYRYADGKIYAGCIYCSDDDIYASVSLPTEYLGRVNGASAVYSTNWTLLNGPEITFKYAAEKEGEYSSELPSTAGEWYVRAYVGADTEGFDIDGIYTTKEKKASGGNTDEGSGAGFIPGSMQPTSDKPQNADGKTGENTKENAANRNSEKLLEQCDNEVQVAFAAGTIDKAVNASKDGKVFKTSDGKIAANTFVEGKKGKMYYTNDDGRAVKKTLVSDGENIYYCGKNGAVVCNKPITLSDGTRILASKTGAIITKENSKVSVNGKSYLTTEGGVLASKEIVTTKKGKSYYANKSGELVTNSTVSVDGIEYKANKKGTLKQVK